MNFMTLTMISRLKMDVDSKWLSITAKKKVSVSASSCYLLSSLSTATHTLVKRKQRPHQVEASTAGSYNVLANHHKKNGAPRPPDPKKLNALSKAQSDAEMWANMENAPDSQMGKKKQAQ
jgi:hypothetical protein